MLLLASHSYFHLDELVNETCHSNSDAIIGAIQEDLRQLLPLEAVVQSEEILPSYNGPVRHIE